MKWSRKITKLVKESNSQIIDIIILFAPQIIGVFKPAQAAYTWVDQTVSRPLSVSIKPMTESFAELFEQSLAAQNLKPGTIVTGTVLEIRDDVSGRQRRPQI